MVSQWNASKFCDHTINGPYITGAPPSQKVSIWLIRFSVCSNYSTCKKGYKFNSNSEIITTNCDKCNHFLCDKCSIIQPNGSKYCHYCDQTRKQRIKQEPEPEQEQDQE